MSMTPPEHSTNGDPWNYTAEHMWQTLCPMKLEYPDKKIGHPVKYEFPISQKQIF